MKVNIESDLEIDRDIDERNGSVDDMKTPYAKQYNCMFYKLLIKTYSLITKLHDNKEPRSTYSTPDFKIISK